jgi:hypothetical protein
MSCVYEWRGSFSGRGAFYVHFNDLRELRDCLVSAEGATTRRSRGKKGAKNVSENGKNEMEKLKI